MGEKRNAKLHNEAYCNCCEDLVSFDVQKRTIKETLRGRMVEFTFECGICKVCGAEVSTDIYYMERRSKAKVKAYNALGGNQLIID